MMKCKQVRTSLWITLAVVSVGMAASDPHTTVRQEFQRAWLMASNAPTDAPTAVSYQDSAALQSYVLYPYLQAARLQRALSVPHQAQPSALDDTISTLLRTQGNAPAVRELKRAWLLDLAQRQQWSLFQTNYSADSGDVELRCWSVRATLAQQLGNDLAATDASLIESLKTKLQPTVQRLWLSAMRLPDVCNVPFNWARDQQLITAEWLEQRARLALKAGNSAFARELVQPLSAVQAEPIRQWAMLIEKPQPAIDALIANPAIKVEDAALLDGWSRLVRKDQDAGVARLGKLIAARKPEAALQSQLHLSLALAMSWSRRSEALDYFAKVAEMELSEQAHEWRVRAALWAGQWQDSLRFIQAMPEALRNQARWRYWQARAEAQLGQMQAAQQDFQQLVNNDDNYYAALAAANLRVSYQPHAQPLPEAGALTPVATQGLQRASELLSLNWRKQAELEWLTTFNALPLPEQLAAIGWANAQSWHDQSIAAAAKLGLYNDYALLYPRPYDEQVNAAAKRSGLSSELIYSVMRQETLFNPVAESSAKARGLLQLLVETAGNIARKNGLPVPTAEDLFKPEVNVPLGALELKNMIDQADGQIILGLAAYNAGPNAMRRWLPDAPMSADVWIENIPYNETRAYVQRILWHSLVFQWLKDGQPRDMQSWLTTVRPLS